MASFKEVRADYLAAVDGEAPDGWADDLESNLGLSGVPNLLRLNRDLYTNGGDIESITAAALLEIRNMLQPFGVPSETINDLYVDPSGILMAKIDMQHVELAHYVIQQTPVTGIDVDLQVKDVNGRRTRSLPATAVPYIDELRGLHVRNIDSDAREIIVAQTKNILLQLLHLEAWRYGSEATLSDFAFAGSKNGKTGLRIIGADLVIPSEIRNDNNQLLKEYIKRFREVIKTSCPSLQEVRLGSTASHIASELSPLENLDPFCNQGIVRVNNANDEFRFSNRFRKKFGNRLICEREKVKYF